MRTFNISLLPGGNFSAGSLVQTGPEILPAVPSGTAVLVGQGSSVFLRRLPTIVESRGSCQWLFRMFTIASYQNPSGQTC